MTEFGSLVLFSADVGRTSTFYRTLGIPLENESHDGGARHAAAELGSIHIAVYAAGNPGRAPGRRRSGSTFAGYYVDSLDDTKRALDQLDTPLLSDHERMPWGCRIVVEDPDGRAVEINDRHHCDR